MEARPTTRPGSDRGGSCGRVGRSGWQSAPVFELAEAALDAVAAAVAGFVEPDRVPTQATASAPGGSLVGRLGDRVADPAPTQQLPVGLSAGPPHLAAVL